MFGKYFFRRVYANIGLSIISGITILSLAGVAMQMGYANFKVKAEKQLHILNSIRFATIAQIGIEEGWISEPSMNESITITLTDIDSNYQLSTNLRNPSETSQNYSPNSSIKIENNNGRYEYYCLLLNEETTHTYTDDNIKVHDLSVENITLSI
ncbi:MAG: hypothetical protein VW397_04255 [Candidatus Margulisiibacteriota bacterium]